MVVEKREVRKLKEMCKTRWVEWHDAFEVMIDLFLPTVSALKQ